MNWAIVSCRPCAINSAATQAFLDNYPESSHALVACTDDGEAAHAAAFLICDCCGATREVSGPDQSAMNAAASAAGYAIARTTIEAHGRCAACREVA